MRFLHSRHCRQWNNWKSLPLADLDCAWHCEAESCRRDEVVVVVVVPTTAVGLVGQSLVASGMVAHRPKRHRCRCRRHPLPTVTAMRRRRASLVFFYSQRARGGAY